MNAGHVYFNHLSNTRHPNESFKNYRARLKAVNKAVRQILRGKFAHVSTSPTPALPLAGADGQVERAILIGEIRDVVLVTPTPVKGKKSEQFRIGRTKGVTRVHPTKRYAYSGALKRAARRKLWRRDWRQAWTA